ncbi:MAG: hypothetical protein ACOCVR_01975 [Myxococcota bacterium]
MIAVSDEESDEEAIEDHADLVEAGEGRALVNGAAEGLGRLMRGLRDAD